MRNVYFVNYYQSNNSKQRYKIKKLLYKTLNYWKMSNQNNEKSPGIKGALFKNTGDNNGQFGLSQQSTFFILFLFCNEPAKKIMAYIHLQLNLPLIPYEPVGFQLDHPSSPPSVRTLWVTLFVNVAPCNQNVIKANLNVVQNFFILLSVYEKLPLRTRGTSVSLNFPGNWQQA